MVFGAAGRDRKTQLQPPLGVNPFFVKDYLQAANVYEYQGIEKSSLLLHQYNLKSIGVNSAGARRRVKSC